MKSSNKEMADWVLRFPDDEMTYHCIAINGCGAIGIMTTGPDKETLIDALKYGLFAFDAYDDYYKDELNKMGISFEDK